MVASARDIATSLRSVNKDAMQLFTGVAHELVEELGSDEALARAIAFIAGVTEKIKGRSLLMSIEGKKYYIIILIYINTNIFILVFMIGYKTIIVTCD